MSLATWFWERLNALTPAQMTMALLVASAVLYLVEERRVALVALFAQYLLVGVIIGSYVYRPILYLFLGIGTAVFLVLLLSAGRVERIVRDARARFAAAGQAAPGSSAALPSESMGPLFNSMTLVLAGVAAYEIWRAYPIAAIPGELTLVSYWLACNGLLLALISTGPLRIGYGLLTFLNGVVSAFLVMERSLLVFALVGALYGIIAMGIAICTEAWLVTIRGDTES